MSATPRARSAELGVRVDPVSENDAFGVNRELSDLGEVDARARLEHEQGSLHLLLGSYVVQYDDVVG